VYPYTLTNGTVADANQVMANFNLIRDCADLNLAHNGANADITSLSGLTTPLSISQGGTGNTTGQPSGAAGGVLTGSYPNPAFGSGVISTSALGSNVVTNATLAQVSSGTVKGRSAAGAGNVQDLTASDLVGILGLVGHLTYAAFTASDTATMLVCDGRAISRTTYARLFAVIGTTWGAGDGSTTFNLPDGRSEFIQGADRGRGFADATSAGSTQGDQIQNITGLIGNVLPTASNGSTFIFSGAFYATGSRYNVYSGAGAQTAEGGFDASRVARAGSTTHPRNIGATLMIYY